jgi:hypothetical protein
MSESLSLGTAAPSAAADHNGRDNRGRFVAGNRGGPGNPFARQTAALRKAAVDAVTAEDVAAIMAVLVEKAKGGDTAAAKLVLGYAVGKPTQPTEPDRLDAEELQRFKEGAEIACELPTLVESPEPELLLSVMRATRPAMTKAFGELLATGLEGPEPHGHGHRDGAAKAVNPLEGWRSRLAEGTGAPPLFHRSNGRGVPKRCKSGE